MPSTGTEIVATWEGKRNLWPRGIPVKMFAAHKQKFVATE